MAYEQAQTKIMVQANADLSASQFCAVKLANSSGTAQAALCGAGQQAAGFLQNKPSAQGRAAEVAVAGVTKAKAGGTVTAGSMVASDSTGRVVNAASGDIAIGLALEGTTNANELVSVLVLAIGKIW
jgi:hypothetical protein